ncbi:MAG: PASTA domain-containing protein, partial [Actinobacteria bacterium]|nr:PASTA domain-containing protein [Actinomycetota bacterium]
RVTMPAVLGLSLEEARAHLEKQGLRVGEISSSPSPRAADTVLAGSENEGTELARDSEVSLTVASGANRIPDVAGMTGQQARSALLNAGFIAVLSETPAPADGATGEPDNGSDSGTGVGTAEPGGEEAQPAPEWSDLIHHSTPSAGTVIPLGSTITLVARPRAPTDPAPPGGTPPPAQ